MKKLLSGILIISLLAVFGYGYFYHPKTAKAGFSYYRSITINHNKVASSTSETYPNFAVMVSSSTLDSLKTVSNGGHVENTNGYDVGFYTNSDCSTGRLAAERDVYSSSTTDSVFWVKQSSISTSTDSTFYMCYGDSSISTDPNTDTTYGATSTWDSAYKGVWHMGSATSLSATDTIGNGSGTIVGSPSSGAGKIGGGLLMTGTSQYINAGSSSVFNFTTGNFTVEAWLKHNSTNPDYQTFIIRGAYITNGWYFQTDNASPRKSPWFVTNQAGSYQLTAATVALNASAWTHLVAVRNGSTVTIYGDGVDKTTSHGSHGNPASVSTDLIIGQWKDAMDEVRISSATRSADWIKTEYNNQSSPSTFITFGAENGSAPSTTDSGLIMIINARTVIFNAPKIFIQ